MAKALNRKNLLALGPDRMADLLIEVTKGRADLQRRLRLELSAHQGPEDVARDLRKRYAAIRQAKGYISRKTHRGLAKEIRGFITLIESSVAPVDAALAFDLIWEVLHLAPGVLARTRDASAILADAFDDGMPAIARLAARLDLPPERLAVTVFDAVQPDGAGRFAGAVRALAPALGPKGLEHLDHLASGPASDPAKGRGVVALRHRALRRDIAEARGDLDGYIALFTPAQRKDPAIASDLAARLVADGRAGAAHDLVTAAMTTQRSPILDDALIVCLEALGRKDELKAVLWNSFTDRPDAGRLRHYLRLLPDFEDIDAEDAARHLARDHSDHRAALTFFMEWPDFGAAASLITANPDAPDGHAPALPAHADALDARYPLAAVLLRRAAILSSLSRGTAAGDRQAADLLLACAEADARIDDYGPAPDHLSFLARLRRIHGRRKAFWARIA